MSDKAAKKKQYILDIAKGVFAKKGFKNVTMKDIVEACEISRGGLYLYFDDTKEILLECLQSGEQKDDILEKPSAGEALAVYLNEQKKAILNNENDLTVAVYEYLFMCEETGEKESVIKPKIEKNLKVLTALLEKGVESDEFYCEDCGELITDRDGHKAKAIANNALTKFGRYLCYDCAVKAKKEQEELV